MKHNWEKYSEVQQSFQIQRKCSHCGAIQTKESTTDWGRITGYTWYPLVGRCQGTPPAESKLTEK